MARANDIAVAITLDGTNYSSTMGKVITLNKRMAQTAQEAGHATVSSMQASSAAIRTLENPLGNNLRALERFVTTIPGVSKVLRFAFPVVGIIALGSVIAKSTEEVVKFVRELNEMPRAVLDGFGQINTSAQSANDELRLTNDTIKNHIALMEGKKTNEVAIELDLARVAADKLGESLRKDRAEIAALLKDKNVSLVGQLFGKGSTRDVQGTIKYGETEMADLGTKYQALADAGDKKGAAAVLQQLNSKQEYYKNWAAKQEAMRSGRMSYRDDGSIAYGQQGAVAYGKVYGDQGVNLEALSGFSSNISKRQENQQLEIEHAALKAKDGNVKDGKEAESKAEVAQMKSFQEQFATLRASFAKTIGGSLPVSEEIAFWQKMQAATKVNGENYIAIQKTLASEMEKQQTEKRSKQKSDHAAYIRQQQEDSDNSEDLARGYAELLKAQAEIQDKSATESLKLSEAYAKANEIQQATAQATAESTLRVLEMTGAISAQDSAVQQASIHQAEYNAKMDALRSAQADMVANPLSDQRKQDDRLEQNQNAQHQLSGQFDAQSILDQAAIVNEGFVSKWKVSLSQMANDFTDFAKGLSTAFQATLSGVNDEIVKVLTAKHLNGRSVNRAFADAGKAGATSLVGAGLKGVEGIGLKALGFGAKPMHVIVDNLPRSGGYDPGNDSSLDKYLVGAGGSPIPSMSPLTGLKDASNLSSFIAPFVRVGGFLASGGPVGADVPVVVGEAGPEIFMPRRSGHIVPNNKVGMGGDTHHHHHNYNIDARHSQNPAATAAAATRAMHALAGKTQAATMKAILNERSRRPRLSGAF